MRALVMNRVVPRGRDARRASIGARRSRAGCGLGVAGQVGGGAPRVGTDPLLTAGEVAELLQVTKAWVYAQTRAQRIPHVPLGRYVRYRRSAVLQWVVALERQASRGLPVPRGGK
ncbi:MAG TPA: helix-turn-helix domain-containing protein [Solirubrobacteraceae bacterium]|nr:helix-turn-helix domain-containing protein [Solirubrobacteraceae bacterium]